MAAAINYFDIHTFGDSSVDVRCAGSCTIVELNAAHSVEICRNKGTSSI